MSGLWVDLDPQVLALLREHLLIDVVFAAYEGKLGNTLEDYKHEFHVK